jgi:hypothetical protein
MCFLHSHCSKSPKCVSFTGAATRAPNVFPSQSLLQEPQMCFLQSRCYKSLKHVSFTVAATRTPNVFPSQSLLQESQMCYCTRSESCFRFDPVQLGLQELLQVHFGPTRLTPSYGLRGYDIIQSACQLPTYWMNLPHALSLPYNVGNMFLWNVSAHSINNHKSHSALWFVTFCGI